MEDDNTWEPVLTADVADAAAMDWIWGGGQNEGCQGQEKGRTRQTIPYKLIFSCTIHNQMSLKLRKSLRINSAAASVVWSGDRNLKLTALKMYLDPLNKAGTAKPNTSSYMLLLLITNQLP